jgi:tetratricopeptide (TPR) repeat protein
MMSPTSEKTKQSIAIPKTLESDGICELGRLYYERCDFVTAIEKYREAAELYFAEKNFAAYLECQNRVLRMYAEREDQDSIRILKEKLQDLVLKEGFELNAKTYYTLGICAAYKNQLDIGLDYFQKSLAIALAKDDKTDICYAINGLSIMYYRLDRLPEALKEIYNLQVFDQILPIVELRLSSQMLNAHILRKMKKYDQALEILWECYGTLREAKNMFSYLCLLYGMGLTYKEAGELDLARMYLQLAIRSVDPVNLPILHGQIETQLKEMGLAAKDDFDLVFDSTNNSVVEKKKGKVDFKNQFILLDMLRLFMKTPGQIYPKEALVKQIWKQDYDPNVHDNKIYVTIKRLRKLIEPDFDKPKYIFRAKNGYYLSKTTRIYLDQ